MKYFYFIMLALFSINSWCDETGKFYAGGGFAYAELSDGGMTDFQSMSNSEGAVHIFGGYQFTPTLAAEITIDGMGSYESETSSSDIYNDYSAVSFAALGKMPLGQGFALYGQLGIGLTTIYQDVTAISGPYLITGTDSDTRFSTLWGAGFSYTFPAMKELELRLGMQQLNFTVNAYAIDNASNLIRKDYDQNIREYYFGVAYHFD